MVIKMNKKYIEIHNLSHMDYLLVAHDAPQQVLSRRDYLLVKNMDAPLPIDNPYGIRQSEIDSEEIM